MRRLFTLSDYAPVNQIWLVFFRCGVAALVLLNFLSLQPDFNDFFAADAYIPPDIANALKIPLIPSIYGIYRALTPVLPISYAAVLITVRLVYPLALLMLAAGLFTRISALVSLLLQIIIFSSVDLYSYGFEAFTSIALFYCVIFPVGRQFSVDALLFKKPVNVNNQYLWILRAHIGIIYLFSGFEKLLGYNWRNGESMWKMVHSYNTLSFINLDFLYKTPIFLVAGWATIILEMFYPLFINLPKTRKFWLVGTVCFHIGIAFFMGLYFFSAMMIIFTISAYYIPYTVADTVSTAQKNQQHTETAQHHQLDFNTTSA